MPSACNESATIRQVVSGWTSTRHAAHSDMLCTTRHPDCPLSTQSGCADRPVESRDRREEDLTGHRVRRFAQSKERNWLPGHAAADRGQPQLSLSDGKRGRAEHGKPSGAGDRIEHRLRAEARVSAPHKFAEPLRT
jgi:hypothetical protein